MTAVEKILERACNRPKVMPGDVIEPAPDFIMVHDGVVLAAKQELDALGITKLADLKEPVVIRPLPGLPVIRDLIVDMSQFFKQYHSIKPYLQNDTPAPEKERLQSPADREELNGLYECILCACCSTACPSFWWNPDKFVGPAGLLQAYRFIADTRDEAINERLDNLEDPYRLFRCHSIMNCVDVCPKGLNPTRAIGKIKELMVKRTV